VLEVCRLLLHAKADVNVTDYSCSSPPLHACESLHSFCFSIRDRTPLSHAVNLGRVDVCRLLLHEKADVSTDLCSPFPCMHLKNSLLISCPV
jgi:ankyrin repeat protein